MHYRFQSPIRVISLSNEMLHSSTTCFSMLHYTSKTVSSITATQLILTGRVFSTQTHKSCSNHKFGKSRITSNTCASPRLFSSEERNYTILSCKSNFSKDKLFSTSSIFRRNEMEEFTLATKYEGSDYNVW